MTATPADATTPSLRESAESTGNYINTREQDVVRTLYQPCLRAATRYVRGAGYFRSSVFRLMSEDLLDFCIRGGTITVVTSVQMDLVDFDAAVRAYREGGFQRDLEEMASEPELLKPVEMLCALIHHRRLDLHIALLREDIYHEKKGYFEDRFRDKVAFDGSGNETRTALSPVDSGNAESFNVTHSWDDPLWQRFGSRWVHELDRLISRDPTLTFPVVHITEVDRRFIADRSVELDLENHREDARDRQRLLKDLWEQHYGRKPPPAITAQTSHLPELRKHQLDGLEAWRKAGKRGVLEHATGSGKTITAFAAINDELRDGGHALVLVPSIPLLHQWNDETREKLPHASVALLGDAERHGLDALKQLRAPGVRPTVVISVMKSLAGEALEAFERANQVAPKPLLVVADECHRLGAPSYEQICKTTPRYRLGLSATPEREGDPVGTQRLFSFLGPVVDRYTLLQALSDRRLAQFEYHPHRVALTSDEQQRYAALAKEIRRALGRHGDRAEIPVYVKLKIFEARRLLKSAGGKIDLAAQTIGSQYTDGQHWLVYVDSEAMMAKVKDKLQRDFRIGAYTYWSGMDRFQRQSTMIHFEKNAGILIAIRCLDEGVDVPAISHGIVLSSSTTRRQFIQRRGRMLRLGGQPNKLAHIYDAIAVPDSAGSECDFVLDEIRRAHEFSQGARNKILSDVEIQMIANEFNVGNDDALIEEESND